MTGKKPGNSTLAVRYRRLKDSISAVAESDIPAMMEAEGKAVLAIEEEIKDLWAKKWARVSKLMEEAGTSNYAVSKPTQI
jgi:hypothetical protein